MSARGDYVWSDDERTYYAGRWWACPRRMVEDGAWAHVWRDSATTRGGGAASSVLPVLALHMWPERGTGAWSRAVSVPIRKLAALAGLNEKTARAGLTHLENAGLLEQTRERMQRGGYRTLYKLAGALYAKKAKDEAYARIAGNLVFGGAWSMIPTPAARHVYIAIAAMDPIGDEQAYAQRAADDHPAGSGPWLDLLDDDLDEDAARTRWLDVQRARHPMSLSSLEQWTGLNSATLKRTLPLLRTPLYDRGKANIALVRRGACNDGAFWYAPDRRAPSWFWKPEALNDAAVVRQQRAILWPALAPTPQPRWWKGEQNRTWHAWLNGRSLCGLVTGRGNGRGHVKPGPLACLTCRKLTSRVGA